MRAGSTRASSTNPPTCWPTRTSPRAAFSPHPTACPTRFATLTEGDRRRRAGDPYRHPPGAAVRGPRPRFRMGAGRLDHDQDARRPRGRRRQGRDAGPPRPVADGRPDCRVAAGRARRQAVVRAPQHVETQPVARHEVAGRPRDPRPTDRLGRPRRREFLPRHDGEARPRLRPARRAPPRHRHDFGQRLWPDRPDGAGVGGRRHRRRIVGSNLSDRLARPRPRDPRRGALWRRHRPLRHARLPPPPRCSIAGRRGAAVTSTRRCTKSASSRCAPRSPPRARDSGRSAAATPTPTSSSRTSFRRRATIAGSRSACSPPGIGPGSWRSPATISRHGRPRARIMPSPRSYRRPASPAASFRTPRI